MARNIEDKTGVSVSEWIERVRRRGLNRHKEIVVWLKTKHAFTHGYANHVALQATGSGYSAETGDALLDQQYSGAKAQMKPIYEKLAAAVTKFGADVQLVPKKHYVSVRRERQFALIQPSTASRVDLGLILKGAPVKGRLESAAGFNPMFTHRVRLGTPMDVDQTVVRWLRAAYKAAGPGAT